MRFEYFPRSTENRYQEDFAAAMRQHGIVMEPTERIENSYLIARANSLDGVHFHWIESIIGEGSTMQRARATLGLYTYLRCLKRLNKRLIWTVHNHARHDKGMRVDALAYRVVARAADLIIVHSRWSGDYIQRKYNPAGRIVVMPHGNYDDFYHPRQSVAQTRRAAGLREDRPVCGVIGSVRPYRGHELAIQAAATWGDECQLFISGKPYNADYGRQIESAAGKHANIRCRLSRLTNDEYAEAVQACDIVLLPYNEVTSSGALLSAWSLSRPVIATALPLFCDFERDQLTRGAIKTTKPTPEAMTDAVRELLAINSAERIAAARGEADRFPWKSVVQPVAQVVQSWNGAAKSSGGST